MPSDRAVQTYIQLRNVAVLAKSSPASDFAFAGLEPGDLPHEVQQSARSWLQQHIQSDNPQSIVAVRRAGAWWLLRAVSDRGTDFSGRPMYYLVLAQAAPVDDAALPWLVL